MHTDSTAARSATAVGALAYTVGRDVVFAPGQYQPRSSSGLRLLAHELSHVVQQDGAVASHDLRVGAPNSAEEREAELVVAAVLHSGIQPKVSSRGAQLARKDDVNEGKGNKSDASSDACALTSFAASNFVGDAVKADVEFVNSLEKINDYAVLNDVKVHVTSSFRTSTNVKGAIVRPVKVSNHLAGHAIDMNLWYGSSKRKFCNGDCLAGDLPNGVSGFIEAIRKDSSLRWGGDFPERDPVHIDDHLNKDIGAWKARVDAVQKARRDGCG